MNTPDGYVLLATVPHTVSLGLGSTSPALLIECPICHRARGEACHNSRGVTLWGKPHGARRRLALQLPIGEGPFRHYKDNPYRVYRARQGAAWVTNTLGWVAPCGTPEDEWAANGWPFPEEPGFAAWFSAANHYEALDADLPSPTSADAYSNA